MRWEVTTLGQVVELERNRNDDLIRIYLGLENIESDTGRVVGVTQRAEDVSSAYAFEQGDVLYGRLRPYLNKVHLAKEPGCCSTEIFPLRTKGRLNPSWLSKFLRRSPIVNELNDSCTGARMPRTSPTAILGLRIPIPPLDEQERIVEVLDEAFTAIDKAMANIERNLTNARELFQSRLNDIFSNPSEDWEVKPLGEVCKKIQDGAHHSPKELFSEGGRGRYRYLTSKHIRPLELQWEKSQWCSKDFHETIWPRCNPEFGDVLLTKDGSNTGNVCLFSLEEPVSLLSSVCVLKADRSIVRPAWILFFILSPMGFKMVTGKMTGAAIRRIILKTIKAAEISFPGVAEQDELIEMMFDLHASVIKVETQYQSELDNLEELRQSILEQAFEGKLTEPVAA